MGVPFTAEQFFGVFTRYNTTVWPTQVALYAVAIFLVIQAARSDPRSDRRVTVLLALLWAWMGVVYHWVFFTEINPAAWLFGGLFVLEAGAFLVAGFRGEGLSFRFSRDGFGLTGAVLLAYALIVYPVLGALAGHAYPRGPTFGLPCPTTIATFGILLWASGRVPGWLVVIPGVWSLLGVSAASRFGILEDYGLLVAGIVGTVLVLVKNRRVRQRARLEAVHA